MSTFIGEPIGAFAEFTNLDDEMVKLVAYTIVWLRRDEEIIAPGGRDQMLVVDRMTEEKFVARLISKYLAEVDDMDLSDKDKEKVAELKADPRYLRVYYVVSRRWPREPLKFEERQIKILSQIQERL